MPPRNKFRTHSKSSNRRRSFNRRSRKNVHKIRKSKRSTKGIAPERYQDENMLAIILEDDNINDVLASLSDIDSDNESDEDYVFKNKDI